MNNVIAFSVSAALLVVFSFLLAGTAEAGGKKASTALMRSPQAEAAYHTCMAKLTAPYGTKPVPRPAQNNFAARCKQQVVY